MLEMAAVVVLASNCAKNTFSLQIEMPKLWLIIAAVLIALLVVALCIRWKVVSIKTNLATIDVLVSILQGQVWLKINMSFADKLFGGYLKLGTVYVTVPKQLVNSLVQNKDQLMNIATQIRPLTSQLLSYINRVYVACAGQKLLELGTYAITGKLVGNDELVERCMQILEIIKDMFVAQINGILATIGIQRSLPTSLEQLQGTFDFMFDNIRTLMIGGVQSIYDEFSGEPGLSNLAVPSTCAETFS